MAAKDLKKIRRKAEEQGWRVEQTAKGHWKFYAPDGENIVTVSGTPSVQRALDNIVADLKRYGYSP